MALKEVQWTFEKKLDCACCLPANVVLCVDPYITAQRVCPSLEAPETTPETSFFYHTVPAVLTEVLASPNNKAPTKYIYKFTYDESLILPDLTIDADDIKGVICDACLGTWIRDMAGDDVRIDRRVIDGVPRLVLVAQHGCQYEFQEGGEHAEVNQPEHGFEIPSFGVLPIRYDTATNKYVLAQADGLSHAADVLAVEIDGDEVLLKESGVLRGFHGLDVGFWYVLDPANAGGVIKEDDLAPGSMNQRLFFTATASTLILRVYPSTI